MRTTLIKKLRINYILREKETFLLNPYKYTFWKKIYASPCTAVLVCYLANQSTRNLPPQINMRSFFNNKNLLWNHHDMMCIHSAENLVKQKPTSGVIHFFMNMLCAF